MGWWIWLFIAWPIVGLASSWVIYSYKSTIETWGDLIEMVGVGITLGYIVAIPLLSLVIDDLDFSFLDKPIRK